MDKSFPLDQTHTTNKFASSFTKPSTFKQKIPCCDYFSLGRKECRSSSSSCSQFRCFLVLDQGLRPRPILRPVKHTKEQVVLEELKHKEQVFSEKTKSSFGWGSSVCSTIEKLVGCKRYSEALELFEILESQNYFGISSQTYDALVGACIGLKSIRGVKRVFNHMLDSGVELDVYMRNRVLLMHVKCGMMIDARQLFEDLPERNFVSWNMIIGGFLDCGDYLEAFRLFLLMWEDEVFVGHRTFAMMIRASAGLGFISPGQQLHACAVKMGGSDVVFVSCALIDMYSKCGNIEDARLVFNAMPEKTTVAWNSIMAAYTLHGYSEEALSMYYEMQNSGAKMDHYTYSIVVRICTRLASLEHAKQAHAGLVRSGFGSDMIANTGLVDFYSKWGRIEDARNVFEKMTSKNIRSWNALISGYGSHGRGLEAVELFERMVREGMIPNHVTFLAVLSACCYSGLSDRGWEIFESMSKDFKVKPRAMHYACMVEFLGREGLLDEAFALIRNAPGKPTINMWAALLTACRVHKNLVLGKYAAEKLYELEPEKLSNYVVLLNIYDSSGNLQDAAAVLQQLRRKGLQIQPVCTWIEIKKQQHVFFSGDKSHPQTKEIYLHLDEIIVQISKHGYVPEWRNLLPDVCEREEAMLLHHAEKMAIAFGLMSTPTSMPLQLVQNHRICSDCHNAIKLISLVYRREIVFRDASRFHHIKDGSCSCGDYW